MTLDYAIPRHLAVSETPLSRVVLVGGCIFDQWIDAIARAAPHVKLEHYLFQHAMDEHADLGDYDFRIAQVPLRAVHPEHASMTLKYHDLAGYEAAFAAASEMIRSHVVAISQGKMAGPTFFLNYMPPQQSPIGRLLPRYDLRNEVYFVEQLNRVLSEVVISVPNSYVIDIAHISGMIGRRFFQDDAFCLTSHGGFVTDYDANWDKDRLEPSLPLSHLHPFDVAQAVETFWNEAVATYRTLRSVDRVKMLCVDLDDTLWRGVPAEQDDVDPGLMEGWPIGLAEALTVLMRRGVILAVVSKNDEARIREIWPQFFGNKLLLEDFAIRKIGWQPKAEAIGEAIAEANVLPDSVVFLDDNPVERAHVKAAHPLVRVIEAPHLDWRRILLWSPEMQVDTITQESGGRNEMIKAQTIRESERSHLSREDFLRSLDLSITTGTITDPKDSGFERAFELINKTNQFNTTGRRWSLNEAEDYLRSGGVFHTFRVADRYTQYGVVAVVCLTAGEIGQFVMSCRVFGLGVEQAILSVLSEPSALRAQIIETPKNGPCRSVFKDAGWTLQDGVWRSETATHGVPEHVTIMPNVGQQAKALA